METLDKVQMDNVQAAVAATLAIRDLHVNPAANRDFHPLYYRREQLVRGMTPREVDEVFRLANGGWNG